jgi:molecular chaperone HscA
LLSADEQAAIDALMREVEEAMRGDAHGAIDAAVEALAKGTEAFAAERMNRGIRQALAGRRVDQV